MLSVCLLMLIYLILSYISSFCLFIYICVCFTLSSLFLFLYAVKCLFSIFVSLSIPFYPSLTVCFLRSLYLIWTYWPFLASAPLSVISVYLPSLCLSVSWLCIYCLSFCLLSVYLLSFSVYLSLSVSLPKPQSPLDPWNTLCSGCPSSLLFIYRLTALPLSSLSSSLSPLCARLAA